jgi:hypothetical protein
MERVTPFLSTLKSTLSNHTGSNHKDTRLIFFLHLKFNIFQPNPIVKHYFYKKLSYNIKQLLIFYMILLNSYRIYFVR